MSNTMCMDTSMFMLYNMTEMYAGLLNGEQTDVTSDEDLTDSRQHRRNVVAW